MSVVSLRPIKILKTRKIIGFQLRNTRQTQMSTLLSRKKILRELQGLQDLETFDPTK